MGNFFQNVYAWWNTTHWSDKGLIVLGAVFVFFLLWKFVFSKVPYKSATSIVYSPWKTFLKLLSLAAFVGMGLGIYWLVVWATPPKSERLFKQIINNQIEQKVAPLEKNLANLAEKSGTNTLSGEELDKAERAREEAWKERERLKNKLQKPPEKKEPVTRVYVEWVIEWYATDGLLQKYKDQAPFIERKITSINWDKNSISISYIDEKKIERIIVLRRDDPSKFYEGSIWNGKNKEYIPIWLIEPEPEKSPKIIGEDKVKNEKTTKETTFWGWESEKRESGSLDMEVRIVKKTSVNKTAS